MLPLVELPEIVRPYAPWFASVFSPEACAQFQRSISGLIVSENKTVDGINRIFVIDLRNQMLWFNENGHLDKGDKIGKGGVPPWQRNDTTMAMNSSERRSGW
jgi:hypothetical protein